MKIVFKYIIILLLTTFSKLCSQNVWELTYNLIGIPKAIECVDTNNIYVVTTNGYPNKLYKSSDQGKNWYLIFDNKDYKIEFNNGMSVPDIDNIFMIFDKGFMLKSSNGGSSFDAIKLDQVNTFESIAMRNKDVGVILNAYIIPNIYYVLITSDSWKTYEKFNIGKPNMLYDYNNPTFINDSILYSVVYEMDRTTNPKGTYIQTSLLKLNIKSKEYELSKICNDNIDYLCILNKNLFFACGQSNTFNGGSCRDAIYKSLDGGKTWRRVLDLYYANKFENQVPAPWGIQSIAFKDSLTGIAVGQSGKIIYTYDGGESWIYESKLHDTIIKYPPPTMIIRYAGTTPLIATFTGDFYTMLKDSLAPSLDNKYSISGRVWEGTKGQPDIPVANGYQVTMTDSLGFYKFTKLKKGNYTIKVLNKYFDVVGFENYYKPYAYHPLQYDIALTTDTTGFDFNAEDLRKYYNVLGAVTNSDGSILSGIEISNGYDKVVSDTDGIYKFSKIESKKYILTPISTVYNFKPASFNVLLKSDTLNINFVASPKTGVEEKEEIENNDFKISNGVIKCNPSFDFQNKTIVVSDITGKQIYKSKLTESHTIETLTKGIYFISIIATNKETKTYKLIID